MSVNCPKCQAELTDFVHTDTLKERVGQLTEKNKALAENLRKVEGLARQAAPLAAKAHGYEFDADSLEMLQARYTKAQAAGYESDFAAWLGDTEGAGRDSVASRFRVQAPARQEPQEIREPKAEPKAERPEARQEPRLPTTPTTAAAPPVVRLTDEQVRAANVKLKNEYATATPERKAAIRTEMEKNRAALGSAG